MMESKYSFIFGFLINYSVLLVMSGSLMFKYSNRFVFLTSLIIWIVFILLSNVKKYAIAAFHIVLSCYAIALFGEYSSFNFNRGLDLQLHQLFVLIKGEKLVAFIQNTILYYSDQLESVPKGLDTQVFIVVAIMITLLVLTLTNKKKTKILLVIPPLFFMIQWIRYVDVSFTAIKWYMIGFMGYLMHIVSTSHYDKSRSKYDRVTSRDYFVYSVLIAAFIVLLTNLTFALYPLEKINSQFSSFMPTFNSMRTGYSSRSDQYIFSFESTMYQPNGNVLGGRITNRNYDLVMLVESEKGAQYLRGRVKDFYTGYSWNSTNTNYANRQNLSQEGRTYFPMRVYLTNIQTATIFAPIGVKAIDLSFNKVFMNEDELFYYNRDSLERRLEYYDLEIYDELFNRVTTNDLTQYLQLPEMLSERVRDISLVVTANTATATEKIDEIRKYLTSNYKYTLFVGTIPYETEFVDHFLFEEKQGYCTYFATAMAIMARVNGIPSRYVEGYITDYKKNEQDLYEVTGDRAHAWAEVYVDGIWQTVEATPHYIEEDRVIDIEIEEGPVSDSFIDNRPLELEEDFEPEINPTYQLEEKSNGWILLLIPVLILAWLMFTWIRIQIRYRHLGYKDKLEIIIECINRDKEFVPISYIPEEYINQYASSVLAHRMSREKIKVLQKMIYSSFSLSQGEKSIIIEEIETIEQLFKKKYGRIGYKMIVSNYIKKR